MRKEKINDMTLRYLSAGDRLNYGDFLFSLIFQHYFGDSFKIKFYGIVDSDFSGFGAIPTQSYKSLIKEIEEKKDIVVIGGGEVFFAKWRLLYSFIYPTYSFFIKNRYFKKIDNLFSFSKVLFFQSNNEFPFVPNLNCENIFISVGGCFSKRLNDLETNYLKKVLKKSLLLSVRDNRTYNSLKLNGVNSVQIPDSAILMSRVFPINELSIKLKNKSLLEIKERYIFLQVGRYNGPKNIVKFMSDMNKIAQKRNLTIICCPIGMAPLHEDHVLLQEFCKLDTTWKFIEVQNIFEIMYLIANSEIYFGTSLHGLITAFSYNKPAIGMNRNIHKLSSFIDTWCSEFYVQSVDFGELSLKVEDIIQKWSKTKALEQLEYCQNSVLDYFSKISKYLALRE